MKNIYVMSNNLFNFKDIKRLVSSHKKPTDQYLKNLRRLQKIRPDFFKNPKLSLG